MFWNFGIMYASKITNTLNRASPKVDTVSKSGFYNSIVQYCKWFINAVSSRTTRYWMYVKKKVLFMNGVHANARDTQVWIITKTSVCHIYTVGLFIKPIYWMI